MAEEFDLVVIGSGPAGEKAAAQAGYFGKRIALVERSKMGGACVHTGTIPSKSLRESALYLSGFRTRAIEGLLQPTGGPVRISDLMAHKDRVCREEGERVRVNLSRHGVELIEGLGSLVDIHTVLVTAPDGTQRRLRGEVILMATGSRPFRPTHLPFDGHQVYDSDDILQLDILPDTMVVVGAGVIGCEYATMFGALGVKVTLIEPRDELLPFLDRDIATRLVFGLGKLGVELRLGTRLESVEVKDQHCVHAVLGHGEILETEVLLYAAGRQGNVESLSLENVGIEADKRGHLRVNEHFQTQVPSIYAVGDLVGFPSLASTSMDQGRVAMCHAFHLDYKTEVGRLLPYGIYTIPEISMVGATEQELSSKGIPYEVGKTWFHENARGRINGFGDGLLKLIFDPESLRVLGVHMVGEQAAELIHIGMTNMQHGGSLNHFIEAVYNFPTLSEAYKYAAYDGLGRLQRQS
jgi:NAD(P) transhydrogenase